MLAHFSLKINGSRTRPVIRADFVRFLGDLALLEALELVYSSPLGRFDETWIIILRIVHPWTDGPGSDRVGREAD
jgi:hypothetical protein